LYCCGQEIKFRSTSNCFSIREICDKGHIGEVFIAKRQKDGKLYALKTLKKWGRGSGEDLLCDYSSFHRESLVWITLGKHQNLVQAYWFDLDENYRPFLIMEYVESVPGYGVTLEDWLDKVDRLPLTVAVCFGLQAVAGLIHAKKMINEELDRAFIHRDIKPQNLLIDRESTLRVADFGLVLGKGGTALYKAPEQWAGREVEEKTDIYALGCVLFEILEGLPAFSGLNIYELRRQHESGRRPAPIKDVPAELNELLMRCLSIDPEARPGFTQVRAELKKVYTMITGRTIELEDKGRPLTPEDLNAKGKGFEQLGYYEKALDCYTQAIESDPTDMRYYLNRANTYISLGDPDAAEADYTQALKVEPMAVEVQLGLARLMHTKGRLEDAVYYYKKALAINPNEPMAYVGLGNIYGQTRRFSKAEEMLKHATSIMPRLAEAYLALGNVSLCKRDYASAESHYKKATSINPFYFHGYVNLARLYHLWERRDERDKMIAKAAILREGIGVAEEDRASMDGES